MSYADDAIGIGTTTTVKDANSIAIGQNANASNGAVAIGYNSVGSRAGSVSFGSTGNERQLTNVATGTADTDAVNVKQLHDAATVALSTANSYTDTRETAINQRTDSLMATEQQARQSGNTATLNSANSYTDTREAAINQRTDSLMATEQQARQSGNTATLNSANSYTDTREAAINQRTDSLMPPNSRRARAEIRPR
jgi:hypothetical protein